MSDLIDRQKAINSVHSSVKFWDDGDVNYLIELIVACLQELPGEEKHGHWNEDWLASTSGGAYQVWRCSECESAFNWRMKYCGHCGVKMDEVKG